MNDQKKNMPRSKNQPEPTILRRTAVGRRFNALFRAMSNDYLLREQFVTDPAQISAEYVFGNKIATQKASVINQLVYSVVSNGKLFKWLHDYSIKHDFRMQSRDLFLRDFGRAVVQFGGANVVLALVRSSVDQQGIFAAEDDGVLDVVVGLGGCAGPFQYIRGNPGTFVTVPGTLPGTGTGTTEQSTGTGTTEQSTGTGTTEQSTGTGTTEQSTGTGTTEQSTGTGTTEQSTGTGTTEQSTGTGTTEQSTGTGTTEQSTGTGTTEQSTGTDTTGTGTEQSTGTDTTGTESSSLPFAYMQVTFEALFQYSVQLREAGALETIE